VVRSKPCVLQVQTRYIHTYMHTYKHTKNMHTDSRNQQEARLALCVKPGQYYMYMAALCDTRLISGSPL